MDKEEKRPARREFKFDILYVIVDFFAVVLIRDLLVEQEHVKTIPYSEFLALVEKDGVTDLVVGPTRIPGAYKQTKEGGRPQHFSTIRVVRTNKPARVARASMYLSRSARRWVYTRLQ